MQVGGRFSLNKGHTCGPSHDHCIWAHGLLCLELRTYKCLSWWSWTLTVTQGVQNSHPKADSAWMAKMTQAPPPWPDKQGWVSFKSVRAPWGSNPEEIACLRTWLSFIIYSCPWYLLDDIYFYFNNNKKYPTKNLFND